MSRKYDIKYEELQEWLESLTPEPVGEYGYSGWLEPSYAKLGEPFLVDLLGGDISVLWRTKRNFKLPTGRLVRGKFDRTLIEDTKEQYGKVLNGVWAIPNSFLAKKRSKLTEWYNYSTGKRVDVMGHSTKGGNPSIVYLSNEKPHHVTSKWFYQRHGKGGRV